MAQTRIKYEAKESEQKPVTNLNCSVLADALVELTEILKFLYLLKAFVNKNSLEGMHHSCSLSRQRFIQRSSSICMTQLQTPRLSLTMKLTVISNSCVCICVCMHIQLLLLFKIKTV